MHGFLKISTLFAKSVILAGLHLQLIFNVLHAVRLHVMLCIQVIQLSVLLLNQLLDTVYLHLTNIDLILVLQNLNLRLLVHIFLRRGHPIQLHTHILDLLGLCMVDVGLAGNVLVALFDFGLRPLILLGNVALTFLRLSQLYFDVAKRVLQLLVFYLAKAEHLPIFNLSAFLALNTEASPHNSSLLQR